MAGKSLDNRAKITVVSIITLVAIACLHWFIYQATISGFNEAYNSFSTAAATLANVKPMTDGELATYRAKTVDYSSKMDKLRQGLQVDYPMHFLTTTPMASDIENRKIDIRAAFKKITDRRDGSPTLKFLDVSTPDMMTPLYLQEIGWFIPKALPAAYQSSPRSIIEDLRSLRTARGNIEALSITAVSELQGQYRRYFEILASKLGIQPPYYAALRDDGLLGQYMPLYAMLAYADLIEQKVAEAGGSLEFTRTIIEELLFLQPLPMPNTDPRYGTMFYKFDIKFPKDTRQIVALYSQIRMLDDLIQRAKDHKVESVTKVRMIQGWEYHSKPELAINSWELFTSAAERAEIEARLREEMGDAGGGDGGYEDEESYEDEGGGGASNALLDRLNQMAGAEGLGETEEDLNPLAFEINWDVDVSSFLTLARAPNQSLGYVGTLIPIEITFQANSDDALAYLYHLAHCERGYELHTLRFNLDPTDRTKPLKVMAVVVGYGYIGGFTKATQ